ncbi:PAS domain S-box protein [Methylobacterium sp. CM6247]
MNDGFGPSSENTRVSSDEFLQVILESATDFAIFALDPDGKAISWNAGAARLFGYASPEMIGQDSDVIFTPEDRAASVPQAERRISREQGRAEDERWHLRKDGSRFWASGLQMPLRDGVPGFVKVVRDRTEQHLSEAHLKESEERFRLLATNIPQLAFRSWSDGTRTWGSPQWVEFTGFSEPESLGQGWVEAVHPEDRAATQEAWHGAQRTGEYYVEHRLRWAAKDEYRWHQTRAKPINQDTAVALEWVGTSTDIHDLRGLQGRQQVLLAELQHRTRNLLAVVQAVARKTMRSSSTLEDFSTEFESRLRALSRVQGLIARMDYDAVELRPLIEAELTAHGDGKANKVAVDGPPVTLPAPAAQALALAVHELATNAVKYGAIGQPSGHLSVTWQVEEDEHGTPRVVLEWRESGVQISQNSQSRRKGYGRELIERALPYQLNARTELEFGEGGVRCLIAVPIITQREGASRG